MKAIQFGCGGNHFPEPWENYDIEVDITKPLPFQSDSVDFVYCSHTAEHLSGPDCFRFFEEVHRILKPSGVFRVIVPSITRVIEVVTPEYLEWLGKSGFGQPNLRSAIENLVCGHGHLIFFSPDTLQAMLYGAGFDRMAHFQYNESSSLELCNKEWHGRVIGEHNDWTESIIMEAQK